MGMRARLAAGAAMGTILAVAQLGAAGDARAQAGPPSAGEMEEVVVTGSRIRRDPLQQTQPVVTLGEEDLLRTGLSSTAEILQRLPGAGGGLNSRFNNSGNFGNPPDGGGVGAGSAEVDLRYLGSRRTLVLVDGLRWVNGSSASGVPSATDLNTIPSGLIDRVEVLQEGASPIYGSDAIAGVINIITKRRQEGFQASAQVGLYEEGDGLTQDYDLTWGAETGGTSIVAGVSYVKQQSVFASDREISRFPTPGVTACDASCSSGTPFGRFILSNPVTGADLDLTLRGVVQGRPVFNPLAPLAGDFRAFTTPDRFNFQPFNYVQAPSERIGTFLNVTQELGAGIRFTGKAVYNDRQSSNQAAPIPLFVGPDAGNGNLLDTISIDASNPFNPFGVTLSSGGATGPANYAFIGRRFVEAGPRQYRQDVDTWYLSGTLDGSFEVLGKDWFWDANGIWSRNKASQSFEGNVNAQRLQQALGPIAGCTAPCVPFNLFGGPGTITPEQIEYVTFTQRDSSRQRLAGGSLNVSGELFDLPAGALGIAVGYEYRDQKGRFDPDATVAAGLGSDIPARPTSGQFDVHEAYGELRVPLVRDVPFLEEVEASVAARYSNYSTFGGETTYRAGLTWRPVEDVLFRGSWGEGFRAPGIGELFGTPSRFDQEIVDPCSDLLGLAGGPAASAAVRANCIARGVPANGSYVQNNPQLSVITGGNPDLQPETSESWTVGAVYSPEFARNQSWADRLDLEVNYYDIKLEGAIQPIGADTILGRCAETLDLASCAAITRTASGAVNQINGLLQNIGAIDTRGIDATITWRGPETAFGSFGLSFNNAILLEYTETVPSTTGSGEIEREGTERGSPDQAFPEYKFTAVLDWQQGDWSTSFTGRYISSVKETQADDNKLGTRFYGDAQVTFSPEALDRKVGLTLGVNNLFDTDPPGCFSCGLNNFDPGTYDVPSRFFYVRLNYRL